MNLTISKTAGFCFGVSRAVNCAISEAANKKICTFGELTHNAEVLTDLQNRGVYAISNLQDVGGRTLLIRSHGISKENFDTIKARHIDYIDCTCPDVQKIHDIVDRETKIGKRAIIIGDKNHPEIIGTIGWASGAYYVFDCEDEINQTSFKQNDEYFIVCQTTFSVELFETLAARLKEILPKISVFNTICKSTRARQKEAAEMSANADIMLVFGDKNSSNTRKLYEACKKNCEKTYLLQRIYDLELKNFSANDRIGITTGASTPPGIIKEAIEVMNDADKNNQSFEELLDEALVTLHTGDVVKGTVISVSNTEVMVNLRYKSDGIIPKTEFTDDNTAVLTDLVKAGDEIEVFVARVNDGEGNVLLSKKKIDSQKGWAHIDAAFNLQTPIRGKFTEVIKGGMSAMICGLRAFVPSSQVSSRYVEDLKKFKGLEFDFKILEYDRKSRRIVAGRKEFAVAEEREQKEKVFETLEVGQKIKGTVSRIVPFGAFVDIGGVDGLIHISQLSWNRIKHAEDVVQVGDEVTVTILDLNRERAKISLSLKDEADDPWAQIPERYPVGKIVEGKVVRMAPFGAFIELEGGVDALLHVSQISEKHVVKPEDALAVGDVVKVKITDVNLINKRISLSKKEVDSPTVEKVYDDDADLEPEQLTGEVAGIMAEPEAESEIEVEAAEIAAENEEE